MIAGSRFLGVSNTNNFKKIRRNSKSLFGVSIESRISRLMKKNGSQKSRWTVPLIGVGFLKNVKKMSFYSPFQVPDAV